MLAPSETGLPGAVGVGNRAMPSPAFPRARSVVVRQNSKRPASGPLERCNCEWGPINSSGGSRHGEEIHCGDCFAMVPEKSRPARGWIRITGCPLHPELTSSPNMSASRSKSPARRGEDGRHYHPGRCIFHKRATGV